MTRPDDIPQDVWAAALKCSCILSSRYQQHVDDIARAILAERQRCVERVKSLAKVHGQYDNAIAAILESAS